MTAWRWVWVVVLASCANDDALRGAEQHLEMRLAEQQEIAAHLPDRAAELATLEEQFAIASFELGTLGIDAGTLLRSGRGPVELPPPSNWEFREARERRAQIAKREAEVRTLEAANGRVGTDLTWTKKQVEVTLHRLDQARRANRK